ncbi:VWA domain-containing protein [Candidatus Fermentibacteria bacterium]|nr:VWA domain-containing protein [Candidatus Fermentibacteria bacterium]
MFKAILIATLFSVAFSAYAQEEPGEIGGGRMQVVSEEGVIGDLPLEHTSVQIWVSGNLQRATVRQVYGNPMDEPIEAVYVFPLPQSGAVDKMDMWIGDRVIHGEIHERELARQIYEDALEAGQTASLLEQERPNIFTQSVGNILPGDSITVEISYVAPVEYDDGEYELVFPMVVGPRFIPGTPTGPSSGGWADPTDHVPDADRITPHVVPEGTRAGYDIDLAVRVDPGVSVQQIESVNHEVTQAVIGGAAYVKLARADEIPNKDFVLRYTTSSDRIQAGVLAHNTEMGGHFMMVLQPDAVVPTDEITPKEMFFVVDCSGSMSGQPMEVAKETVRQFVAGMNPDDSFQIIRFSETASGMSRHPLENTEENVEQGIDYINSLYGSGGTMMIEGIRASVGYPEDPERMRFVIFLTDGYIGNEAEILGELQHSLGENTRLFSVGVGSSPNRYLIESLAEEGRGHAYYVALNEDPSEAVGSIYEKINDPYLVGIDIDWGELDVHSVYPEKLPDLYAGQPLVVVGRYDGSGSDEAEVSGTIAGEPWSQTIRVDLPQSEESHDVIQTLWARKKIHELNREMYDQYGYQQHDQDIVDQITDVALDYQIMSKYTAFVAVSEEVRVDQEGRPITVEVPVNMPDGVSYDGVFGETGQGIYTANTRYRSAPAAAGRGLGGGVVGQTEVCEEVTADFEGDGYYSSPEATEETVNARLVSANPTLGLRPSEMRSALREMLGQLEDVYFGYLEELEPEDYPSGLVAFALEFDSRGNVTDVTVTTGLEEDLDELLMQAMQSATIPRSPEGGGMVTVQFELRPY